MSRPATEWRRRSSSGDVEADDEFQSGWFWFAVLGRWRVRQREVGARGERSAFPERPLRAARERRWRRRAAGAGLLRRLESRPGAGVDDRRPEAVRPEAVLLRTAARRGSRPLPARGAARPREARCARVGHEVRGDDAADARAPRGGGEAPLPAPEAGLVPGRRRDLLRGGLLARGRARRARCGLARLSRAPRLPRRVRRLRALHLACRGDAGAEGGAGRGAVRHPDPTGPGSRSATTRASPTTAPRWKRRSRSSSRER